MLDIYFIEEYNIVKYMRHEFRKETKMIVSERISQGTRYFPARTSQGYRCLETDHQYD